MSGHSHWHSIKHKKEITDKKRGQLFSKVSREISIAAREKGENPEFNPKLRLIIEKAKNFNMPSDSIEKAIKKGVGKLEGEKLEEVLFEAYGPGGAALMIEGITDNKNRALGEIKQVLSQHQGKLVGEGGVKWMFERKIKEPGSLEWTPKQEIETDEKTKESLQKLFESLDELDSVQEIYTNIKM